MGDLSRRPAKLEDDDKREVVDEDGPTVGVVAPEAVCEDEREGNDDAYCTCKEAEQELLASDWPLRLNDAEQEILDSDWLFYMLRTQNKNYWTVIGYYVLMTQNKNYLTVIGYFTC